MVSDFSQARFDRTPATDSNRPGIDADFLVQLVLSCNFGAFHAEISPCGRTPGSRTVIHILREGSGTAFLSEYAVFGTKSGCRSSRLGAASGFPSWPTRCC